MSDLGTAIATGCFGLAGGLGAAMLANASSKGRAKRERRDRIIADQRQLIIDVIHSGMAWSRSSRLLVGYLLQTFGKAKGNAPDRYDQDEREFRRNLAAARVIVTEPHLAPEIRTLSERHANMSGLLFALQEGEGEGRKSAGMSTLDNINRANTSVERIERLATEYLTDMVDVPPTWIQWSWQAARGAGVRLWLKVSHR